MSQPLLANSRARLPNWVVGCVLVLCAIPAVLNWLGYDFRCRGSYLDPAGPINLSYNDQLLYDLVEGQLVHTILEWTSFCICLFTAVFAFTHYFVARDVTTPIIGAALFLSGTIDAIQLLFADSLFEMASLYGYTEFDTFERRRDFVFFSSAFGRAFSAGVLIAGVSQFINRSPRATRRRNERELRFRILVVVLFFLLSVAIVGLFATVPDLPQTLDMDVDAVVKRPWEMLPLLLYLLAGSVFFPRFYKAQPSLFSHALFVSVVPHIASLFYSAFGSQRLFDNSFNISLYLKNVAYLVPLVGLLLDYIRAYRTEVQLSLTQEKLSVARRVQQGLLPSTSPDIDGFDLAGASYPADMVGGDYFDFVPMHDQRLGIVVADVSGHEIGASILMAQTRAYLRALATVENDISAMMTQVNTFLSKDVQNRWFVTLFLIQLDTEAGTFEYCAAGHEAHLLNSTGKVRTFESTSPPLGVVDQGRIACGPNVHMRDGDIFLLFTDGIIEAASPSGEHFGQQRVFDTVLAHRERTANEIVQSVYEATARFGNDAPLVDDVTFVVLKKLGKPPNDIAKPPQNRGNSQ